MVAFDPGSFKDSACPADKPQRGKFEFTDAEVVQSRHRDDGGKWQKAKRIECALRVQSWVFLLFSVLFFIFWVEEIFHSRRLWNHEVADVLFSLTLFFLFLFTRKLCKN